MNVLHVFPPLSEVGRKHVALAALVAVAALFVVWLLLLGNVWVIVVTYLLMVAAWGVVAYVVPALVDRWVRVFRGR